MATTLHDMRIDEISIVDDPANPHAQVTIVKSRARQGGEGSVALAKAQTLITDLAGRLEAIGDQDPEAAALLATLTEASMDIEQLQKSVEAAEARLEEIEKANTAKDAEIAELKKQLAAKEAEIAKGKAPAEDDEEAFLKSLPAGARARFEALAKATKDAQAAAERANIAIEKAAEDREEAEAITKAKTIGFGKAEEVGPLLRRVRKGTTTDADATKLEGLLKQAAAQSKPLFKGVGSLVTDTGEDDPEAVLKAKAADLRKADPKLSPEAAYDQALEQNPDLYDAYLAKRRGASAA